MHSLPGFFRLFGFDFACPFLKAALQLEQLVIAFFLQEQCDATASCTVLVIQVDRLVCADFLIALAQLRLRDIARPEDVAGCKVFRFPDIDELRFSVALDEFFLVQVGNCLADAQEGNDRKNEDGDDDTQCDVQ